MRVLVYISNINKKNDLYYVGAWFELDRARARLDSFFSGQRTNTRSLLIERRENREYSFLQKGLRNGITSPETPTCRHSSVLLSPSSVSVRSAEDQTGGRENKIVCINGNLERRTSPHGTNRLGLGLAEGGGGTVVGCN